MVIGTESKIKCYFILMEVNIVTSENDTGMQHTKRPRGQHHIKKPPHRSPHTVREGYSDLEPLSHSITNRKHTASWTGTGW